MNALRRSTRLSSSSRDKSYSTVVVAAADAPEPKPKRTKLTSITTSTAAKEPPGISRYHEQYFWNKGFTNVAGVDEAGRGPLAGPVVAAACIVPKDICIDGIDDSKKLTAEKREDLYKFITTHDKIIWAVNAVDVDVIDSINILQATMLAMELSVQQLPNINIKDTAILVDGNRLPKSFNPDQSKAIVKGDGKSVAIAAASVVAKVHRDHMMEELHKEYPQYNFAGHKGYGVPEHVERIREHGPCRAHRKTFAPVKTWYPDFVQGDGGTDSKKQKKK